MLFHVSNLILKNQTYLVNPSTKSSVVIQNYCSADYPVSCQNIFLVLTNMVEAISLLYMFVTNIVEAIRFLSLVISLLIPYILIRTVSINAYTTG